jgi:hypothetical protein
MWEEYAPSRLSPIANPAGIYVVGRDDKHDVAITTVPTTEIKGYSMRNFPKDTLVLAGLDRCFSYPNALLLMHAVRETHDHHLNNNTPQEQESQKDLHTLPEFLTITEIKRGMDSANSMDIHKVLFPIPQKKQPIPEDGIVFDATNCMPLGQLAMVGAKGRVVFITGFNEDSSFVMHMDLATKCISAVTHKCKHTGGDTMGVVLGCIDM